MQGLGREKTAKRKNNVVGELPFADVATAPCAAIKKVEIVKEFYDYEI
ncbi:MAG: hypothetical protein U9Q34_07910 [Elusimicrobiota bacterium]|nr:hypothetical protein [Elusimicrobiota bacterium]